MRVSTRGCSACQKLLPQTDVYYNYQTLASWIGIEKIVIFVRPTQKTGEWPFFRSWGDRPLGLSHELCDQLKKLASGYALDRIMPRCQLLIRFIMICATNTENCMASSYVRGLVGL